jgi:bifunctional enzyme CysN/CysC
LIVLVSFISPFRLERRMARELLQPGEFVEVFVDASVEECARRDVKGLYEKAFRGEIKEFTGVSDPYEAPASPEICIESEHEEPEVSARRIVQVLEERGLIQAQVAA